MSRDQTLVLGSNGFIGHALIRALVHRESQVIALSRSDPRLHHPLIKCVQWSAEDSTQLGRLLANCTAVIHVATTSTPGGSAGQPRGEVTGNLYLTATLLESLQQYPNVRLLYLSSGGSVYRDDLAQAADEDSPVRPHSYHGAGKLAAEYLISSWCDQYNGTAIALRPSNVYGPGQPERAGFGIIPAAMGAMLRHETLHIWGNGTARRDYVYINDVVQLCLSILVTPTPTGLLRLNASSGIDTSLNELFEVIETVCGRPLFRRYESSRSVDASRIAITSARAEQQFGWRANTTLAEGIRRTWKWRESLAY